MPLVVDKGRNVEADLLVSDDGLKLLDDQQTLPSANVLIIEPTLALGRGPDHVHKGLMLCIALAGCVL